MSEEKEKLVLKLLGPAAESAGSTLQNVWEYVFGGFDLYVKKKQFVREKSFAEFKESFETKVIEIPADSMTEPKLSILGPTLEASKFYFEEKPLREMFASLAAASMDKRKEKNLHPSFPEIIKQMSPLDAENLRLFTTQFPVVEYYKTRKGSESRRTLLTNVFLGNKDESDLELQSQSLSSLSRLGLINIEYERMILKKNFYTDFFTTPYFLKMSMELEKSGYLVGVTFGRAKVTPFGNSFMSVCLT